MKASLRYIERHEDLDPLVRALSDVTRFGVDTESNSLHAYREEVCFLQIAAGGETFVVDTLAVKDLSRLAPFFADPEVTKILHGADYDVSCLGRDFSFHFEGLFDTMIAAQLLGHERLGLQALVEHYCGVHLEKAHTRYDWGRRPVGEEHLRYMAEDVIYLERLHDALCDELREADIEEEAAIEFARVSRQPPGRTETSPEAFRRIKGAGKLDQTGLSVLKQLHLLREKAAERLNRPPFKVLGNHLLMAVARSRPRTLADLARIRGFPESVLRRHGQGILAAVARGIEERGKVPLRSPEARPRMPREQAAVVDGLKEWRRRKTSSEGRSSVLILPNHTLQRLAQERPRTLEELAAVDGLGRRRLERYGKEILDVIAHPPSPERHRKKGRRDDS